MKFKLAINIDDKMNGAEVALALKLVASSIEAKTHAALLGCMSQIEATKDTMFGPTKMVIGQWRIVE